MSHEAEGLGSAHDAAATTPPGDPLVGRIVDGRYRIEEVLGEGGMGLVYRARHAVLGRQLAVKVLRPEFSRDHEVLARFRQEAQSASAVGNQHIIDIIDFGTLPDGSTYCVMEFLDGTPLSRVISTQAPLPPARVCAIAKQICDALGAAHGRDIVHRDLKPDNIHLIRRGQDTDFVKVLDFGIAKVGGASSRLTEAGKIFGTPHYMSPEQAVGGTVDHRTDIYALGVILYEMCTGRVPFDADSWMGVLSKHLHEQPTPPRQLPTPVDVPPELEAVILKCLAKDAGARYQTMAELGADLERIERGLAPKATDGAERVAAAPLDFGRAEGTGPVNSQMHLETEPAPARPRGGAAHARALAAGIGVLGLVGGFALVFLGGGGGDHEQAVAARPEAVAAGAGETGSTARLHAATSQADPAPAAAVVAGQTSPDPGAATAAGETSPDLVVGAAAGETSPDLAVGAAAGETSPDLAPSLFALSRMIRITSDPPSAEVWRGDTLVGNTPVEVPRPSGEETIEITLRRAGYHSTSVRLSSLTQPQIELTLVRASSGPPPRPPGEGSRSASGAGSGSDHSAPVGRSGLDQPSPGVRSELIDPWR
jgi:serine/threonine-protein kinase